MTSVIVVSLNLMAIGLIVMMVYQGLTRKVELLSYRNVFLIGFIIFQLIGGAIVIASGDFRPVTIERPREAVNLFLIYSIVFLFIFLLSYHWGKLVGWLARWFRPKRSLEVSDWSLLLVAVAFAGIYLFSKFIGWRLPVVGYAFDVTPFGAAAAALVGWVWGGRRFNLAVLSLGGSTVFFCMILSMIGGGGRRDLIAVCCGLLWGAYFRLGQRVKPAMIVVWILPFLLVAFYFVGAFSTVRHMLRGGHGTQEDRIRAVLSTPIQLAYTKVLENSRDAVFTMWALDAYPDPYDQKHLYSFQYMFYHLVPKTLWPEKPAQLSSEVARLAKIKGVPKYITLPPCVLGYAHAEGGLYALVLYAAFFGQYMRFFDELIRQNRGNPFIILATGCTLGHLVGLARGDLPIWTNLITLGFVGVWILLLFARLVIARSAPVVPGGAYMAPRY